MPDSPSVAVNQLNVPTLNIALAPLGPNEPPRDGGVMNGSFAERPKKNARAAAALGRQL